MATNPLMAGINGIISKHMAALHADLIQSLPGLVAQAMGVDPAAALRQETAVLAAPKKKRGRPKKVEAAAPAADAKAKAKAPKMRRRAASKGAKAATEDAAPKRRPGRPKGSKNKPKDVDPANAKPVAVAPPDDGAFDALREKVASIQPAAS